MSFSTTELKNSWLKRLGLKCLATFFKHVGNSVKTHGHNHFGASLVIPHICTDLVSFAWNKKSLYKNKLFWRIINFIEKNKLFCNLQDIASKIEVILCLKKVEIKLPLNSFCSLHLICCQKCKKVIKKSLGYYWSSYTWI